MASSITREYLEFQSDRIEAVLASHKIPVRVHGGAVAPRWIRFHFTAAPSAKLNSIRNLSEEIAMALGASDVRLARDGDSLALEVPRPDAESIRLLPLMKKLIQGSAVIPPVAACIGVTDDGRPLLLRLPSPDVSHVLVAGMTGSGKTELMRTLLVSLAAVNRQSKLQMALIDPKARGFAPLANLPHVLGKPATDVPSATIMLERLVNEMDRRDRARVSSPRIIIAVDEVVDLLMMGGKQVEMLLTRIAQRGREAGLHLILGAQKPSSTILGANLKANLPVRLVGRVGSTEDARVAAGVAGSYAEKLRGQGDFIAVSNGNITHFQVAHIPSEDMVQFQKAFQGQATFIENDEEVNE